MPAPIEKSRDHRCWLAMAVVATVVIFPCVGLAQPTPTSSSPPSSNSSASPSSPQSPRWPGLDDMTRALKAQPLPTPERLATKPPREMPRIAPVAPDTANTPSAATIDIAAMARQGAALGTPPPAANGTSALRIFITLDMPRASLQRLVDQAERSAATLVLRGLKSQSMRQTLAAVGALIQSRRVSWVIDPDAFTRFSVSAAPTFVLALADEPTAGTPGDGTVPDLPRCGGNGGNGGNGESGGSGGTGCTTPAAPAAYLSISGDVSLDYALDAMLRRSPVAVPGISAILQRLRKS